jgi:hypothetical protein
MREYAIMEEMFSVRFVLGLYLVSGHIYHMTKVNHVTFYNILSFHGE